MFEGASVSDRLDRLRFKSKTDPILFLNQEYIYSISKKYF